MTELEAARRVVAAAHIALSLRIPGTSTFPVTTISRLERTLREYADVVNALDIVEAPGGEAS